MRISATFIMKALAPAKVISVELFEDDGVALVIVPDYQLSLAIGREGQNVRLAARLTGWRLDITSETEADEARERYMAERAERTTEEAPPAEAAEEGTEAVAAEGVDIDAELIRKLEEFRRERLGSEKGGAAVPRTRPVRRLSRPLPAAAAHPVRSRIRPAGRPTLQGAEGRRPGRGVYLCSPACVKKAEKNKRYPGLASAACRIWFNK